MYDNRPRYVRAVGDSWVILFWRISSSLTGSKKKILPLERFVSFLTDMQTCLPAVAQQLFRDIKKIYEETSQSKKCTWKWRIFGRFSRTADLARSPRILKLANVNVEFSLHNFTFLIYQMLTLLCLRHTWLLHLNQQYFQFFDDFGLRLHLK